MVSNGIVAMVSCPSRDKASWQWYRLHWYRLHWYRLHWYRLHWYRVPRGASPLWHRAHRIVFVWGIVSIVWGIVSIVRAGPSARVERVHWHRGNGGFVWRAWCLTLVAFVLDIVAFVLDIVAFVLDIVAFVLDIVAFVLDIVAFVLDIVSIASWDKASCPVFVVRGTGDAWVWDTIGTWVFGSEVSCPMVSWCRVQWYRVQRGTRHRLGRTLVAMVGQGIVSGVRGAWCRTLVAMVERVHRGIVFVASSGQDHRQWWSVSMASCPWHRVLVGDRG
jgi:hypothetical protein